MNNNECQICFDKYDRAKRIPHALVPCGHTICLSCIKMLKEKRCPSCSVKIEKSIPNLDMMNSIEKTGVEKAKENLEKAINETDVLKREIQQIHDNKSKETTDKMKQLRSELNVRTEDVIKLVHANQRKLLDQAISIETKAKENLNERIQIEQQAVRDKLEQCRSVLESNDESQISTLMSELSKKKAELKLLVDKMKSTRTEYSFEENKYTKITSNLIGEISQRKAEPSNKADLIKQLDDIIVSLDEDQKKLKKSSSRNPKENKNKSTITTTRERSAADLAKLSELMTKATNCLNGLNKFQFKKSIEYLDEIIKIDPTFHDPYGRKGYALGQLERYQEALNCFDESLKIEPDNAETYIFKGESYRELNQLDESLANFDRAIELDRSNLRAYLEKARILCHMERMRESLNCFEMANRLDPNNYYNAHYKVLCLTTLNRHEEALRCVNQALNRNPMDSQLYMAKSGVFQHQLRFNLALDVLNEGLRYLPNDPNLLKTKANLIRMVRN